MVMFFKKKTVTLNIAVGQQFTTCDLQMNSWSWEEKDLFLFGFFFFFLIQFSRTPLVLSHKKFVTWGGLQQYEFNIWTALRKKDSICSIWSQRVMWGAAGKHFRKIVFNVGKSLRLKVSIGMGAHLEGCRGWMTLYKDLQI